jgi:hypothetical protein
VQRIATATSSPNLNGTGKAGFVERSAGTARAPTLVSADWFNNVQEELCNVIESAGLILNASDRTQLAQAIAIASTGSASANAISIRGTSVTTAAPTNGDVIKHNGIAYAPGKISDISIISTAQIAISKLANAPADGYLIGSVGGAAAWQNGATVLRGVGISTTPPTASDVLVQTSGAWTPGKLVDANISASAGIQAAKVAGNGSTTVGFMLQSLAGVATWTNQTAFSPTLAGSVGILTISGIDGALFVGLMPATGGTTVQAMTWPSGDPNNLCRILFNRGPDNVTLVHQASGQPGQMRFWCPGNADMVVQANTFVMIFGYGFGWNVMKAV